MRRNLDKDLDAMSAGESSDSEIEEESQMSRSESSIRPPNTNNESTVERERERLPEEVNHYFQSLSMGCFPEAEGMPEKAQPWKRIWAGPQPPAADGKLLVACPKNCQWGSGSGLGGY